MAIFFTADTHFGHTNIIEHVGRAFADVEEMNRTIIKNWNATVKLNDTVYHLGDVSILKPEQTREIVDRLNGKIFLIRGNHEKSAEHKLCQSRFEWIKDYHFLSLNGGIKIALMHYVMRVWDRKHYGSWHLYGHSHGKLEPEAGSYSLDVGVDCWEYRPVSLQKIRMHMESLGWISKSSTITRGSPY